MIAYVLSCWDDETGEGVGLAMLTTGAFGAHPGHDGHIHATLSALQVLIIQDALDRVDVERVVKCTVC